MGYSGHNERRERILSAALSLLAESGIERLSVRAVAKAAGIGTGTLRHYFPNQKSLHEALILRLVDDEVQDYQIRDSSLPPADRLEQCLLQFTPTAAEASQLIDVWFGMYRLGLDPSGSHFAREFLEISTTRSRERIQHWLEILAAEGHVAPPSVRTHLLELSALIAGTCLELATPGTEMTVDDAHSIVSRAARAIPKEART